MKRVLLVLSLCVVGGVATSVRADECCRSRCRESCPAVAGDECHSHAAYRGEHHRGPVRRLLHARPIRRLLMNRPVRQLLSSRCCG